MSAPSVVPDFTEKRRKSLQQKNILFLLVSLYLELDVRISHGAQDEQIPKTFILRGRLHL